MNKNKPATPEQIRATMKKLIGQSLDQLLKAQERALKMPTTKITINTLRQLKR